MGPRAIRIVERQTPLGTTEAAFYEPPPHLREHILSYQGYTEHFHDVITRKALPNRGIVFVINLGDPVGVIDPHEPLRSREHASTFIAGLHERYVMLEQRGFSHGIQVNLTPVGGRLFLGVSMHEIANYGAHLSDILGPAAEALTERLREARDWPARFAILDAALSLRIASAREVPEGVAWAWQRIDGSHGRASITQIADRLGWSHRHLIAQFREQVGLAPRTVGRIARFSRAITMLQTPSPPAWTDIALRSGYYDQAHLIRDFRDFAGATPTAYLRELAAGG